MRIHSPSHAASAVGGLRSRLSPSDGSDGGARISFPDGAVSYAGRDFEPCAARWKLDKDVTIDFGRVQELLAPPLHDPYRAVLLFYAQSWSAAYCVGIHQAVPRYLRAMGVDDFSEPALRRYRASLGPDREWMLATMRAFLLRWHNQGYPGIGSDAAAYLRSVALKGNEKGAAVLSLDPDEGPFDDDELASILETTAQQFETGRIDLVTLCVVLLLVHTGRRPGQLSLLRLGDLGVPDPVDSASAPLLRVPRSKQRRSPPRSQFNDVRLPPDVFRALVAQRAMVVERVQGALGTLADDVVAQLPLFPKWSAVRRIDSVETVEAAFRTDALHMSTGSLTAKLGKISVLSARTGRRLHITARRFRSTLATRAARQGHGPVVVAELLDHTDIQNVGPYTRQHPNFRRKIDAAVGQQLAPLADMFLNRVVGGPRAGCSAKRVGAREHHVGSCASDGFCGASAAACYTCVHFEPWLDAPHDQMLVWLLRQRQRAADAGASEDVVSATDRSILAARAVIAACEATRTGAGP